MGKLNRGVWAVLIAHNWMERYTVNRFEYILSK